MAKRLIWTQTALAERKEIFTYWNNRNKSKRYSRKLNELFNEALQALLFYPKIGRLTDFEGIRVIVVRVICFFIPKAKMKCM